MVLRVKFRILADKLDDLKRVKVIMKHTFLYVRQQCFNVVHEMSHAMCYTPRGEQQHSLLVSSFWGRCSDLVDIHIVRLSLPFSFCVCLECVCLLSLEYRGHFE